MAATTQSDLTEALKELYPQDVAEEVLYDNRPMLGMLRKDTDAGGRYVHLALRYAPGPGASFAFTHAQGNVGPSKWAGFDVTYADLYGVFQITGKALRAYKGDKKSLIRDLEGKGDAVFNSVGNKLARALYGNTGGAIGQVGSTATDTLTLLNKEDIVNFFVGQTIDSDDTDGTSGAVDGDPRVIAQVDDDLGTLTLASGTWTSGGNYADNDYLFAEGDFGAATAGFRAWVPDSAPGATAFFGQDRSLDTVKLGGIRYTASAATDGDIKTSIFKAATRAHRQGGRPDKAFLNPTDFGQLVQEVESKTTNFREAKGSAVSGTGSEMGHVFYKGVTVWGPNGPIECFSDPWCPYGRVALMQMDTWCLYSLGEFPGWLDDDGSGQILRVSTADAYEGRIGGYHNLACDAPGYNVNINIAAVQQ